MLTLLFALLSIVAIVVTALPRTNLRHWLVRGNDFPRLQYATVLAALLVTLALWHGGESAPSPLWALPLLAALAYQLYWITPYSTLHRVELRGATKQEIASRPALKLLTSNVLMDNRDASRLIAHVLELRPHVLLTLESDDWWQERLDAALDDWPHRIACPLSNRYGMHLYSRLPLDHTSIDFLVEDDIPSFGARFGVDGLPIRFHAIHPTPPAPGENPRSTERDVELLTLADALTDSDERIIVTGDLNDVAWSRTTQLFRRRSSLLDPRVGRGMFNTFHADWPILRWPLDHVFLSGHFALTELRRLSSIGSDHFPVYVDLRILEDEEQDGHLEEEDMDKELETDIRDTEVAQRATTPGITTDQRVAVAFA